MILRFVLAASICIALIVAVGFFVTNQHPVPLLNPIGSHITPESSHELLTLPPPIVYGYLPYWTEKKAHLPSLLTNIAFFSIPIHADGTLLTPRKPIDYGYKL